MGQAASGGLTQYDVENVIEYCNGRFNQAEVSSLYQRFCALDRGRKGYISADEFLSIPELSINPIAQRLVRLFDCVNFRDFAKLLSAFSTRATREEKIATMFSIYDVDGDGVVTRDDMVIMLRQLAGSSLSDDDLREIVRQALAEAGTATGLDAKAFTNALLDVDLSGMVVDIPVEL